MLLLGTRKGLFAIERTGAGGRRIQPNFLGIPVPLAIRDPRDGTIWAALEHGHWGPKLHKSTDDAVTFEEVGAPAYPEGEEVKDGVPAKLENIWALAAGGDDQPGRLWMGTNPGGLFRSDDHGQSWSLVRGLWDHPSRKGWFGGGRDTAGIHSILVDPRDSTHIFVGISCAGVFESRDDGATWAPRNKGLRADFLPDPASEVGQDPHLIDLCTADPTVMWQQNHCGIFRSTDGADSWYEVGEEGGPANFGFAIAAHEMRPDWAWVVPAQSDDTRIPIAGSLVVCRTEDGGRSWQTLRRGLPQDHAYDLVYRHALALRGETLAFGSTTGNLYLSQDGGDYWETVATNLPPIYSVRFA